MYDLTFNFKKTLKDLERFKQGIMRNINLMGENDQAIRRTTVYPMAKVKPSFINDYPVFQFGYEGILPVYKQDDYDYLAMIRNYYYRATYDAYDYSQFKLPYMEEVVIIYAHYFDNYIIRDLDNRNKKYIQDAIRHTGIIKGDSWRNVWNMDIAFLDKEKCHVQVYVVPMKKITNFLEFLMENHENLKNNTDYLMGKEKYHEAFIKEKEKEEADKKIKNPEDESDKHFW